jgi:DNA ligase-1
MIKYLLSKSSTGKFRWWVCESDEEWHEPEHGYIIQRSYGQVGGKTTLSPTIIVDRTKQKRSWKEQLELQFNSEVKKQLDKGYIEVNKHPNEYTEEELNDLFGEITTNQYGVIKPMLAKQESKVTNRKIFDKKWLASRKINGVRMLLYWNGSEIKTSSRGGDVYDYSTTHITQHPLLIRLFTKNPKLILDGELYKHGKSLQQISGAARMEKNAYSCDWLEYYVYDLIKIDKLDMKAKDRIHALQLLGHSLNLGFDPYKSWKEGELQLQLVPQVEVSGWDNMKKLHDQYVSEGFEGLVIRDPNKPYKPNGRTNDMIKIKNYIDNTFLVVGYQLGLRGSEDMCFICQMEDGRTFKAMPLGDRAVKEEYIQNFDEKYKGHLGDCKYFELSDEGKPCQPKFLAFRFDLE